MPTEPTNQQLQLQESCPHQNWSKIDLSQHEYYVRRSYFNPRDTGFISESEPTETRPFHRPTPALIRSWEIARAYRDQGYNVTKDIQWGVHQLSKAGERSFYLFIEYSEKSTGVHIPPTVAKYNGNVRTEVETTEYLPTSIRIEKRMLKVLKAIAELEEKPLNELLEDMVVHALNGTDAFDNELREHINQFKRIYGLNIR